MRISALALLLVALSPSGISQSQAGVPMMSSVEPDAGKIGDVLTARGENLGRESVSALYLTDGITDVKVPIVDQAAASIMFRIPRDVKAGRFALMVLTTGKVPRLIELPVKITVAPETAAAPQ
jgi:hypothetical protein